MSAIRLLLHLIRRGKAEEILTAYSDHMQSCNYVYGIVQHVADMEDDRPMATAQQFARNLLDDWSK